MDEPCDGLDPAARLSLYQAIRQYANDHDAAVVITTHILGDIEKIADRVAIIDRGRLLLNAELEILRQEVRQVIRPVGAGPITLCSKTASACWDIKEKGQRIYGGSEHRIRSRCHR